MTIEQSGNIDNFLLIKELIFSFMNVFKFLLSRVFHVSYCVRSYLTFGSN